MTASATRKRLSLKHVGGAALSTFLVVMSIPPAGGTAGGFPEGVASRATAKSAILWTRAENPGDYRFRISERKDLANPVARGPVEADADDNNTIKKTLNGSLDPSTRYYFRFFSDDDQSARGTFRTLPANGKRRNIELALSGDSDELWDEETFDPQPADGLTQIRPFSVLDRVREENPDLFVYMGDTIYSDSETGAPLAETIEEKWAKYRNNRLAATMDLLKRIPTWAVWDDHEVVNDFDGAELSNDDPDLFNAGLGAFRDFWPIPDRGKMYGKVNFGRGIDLIFLDERRYRERSADLAPTPCRENDVDDLDLAPTMPQEQRDDLGLGPVDPDCLSLLRDPSRSMLGNEQLDWLKDQLRNSDARWKLIINEVPITQLFVQPYDRWEGYEGERRKILNLIKNRDIRGVVFLTTDLHANVGSRVYKDITAEGANPITYEMITGPIQTCTLDCEVDTLLGSNLAGEFLQELLVNEGLADAPCINIDLYAYGLVSTFDKTKRLRLEWKSHEPKPGEIGGEDIFGCDDKNLRPSVSGDR